MELQLESRCENTRIRDDLILIEGLSTVRINQLRHSLQRDAVFFPYVKSLNLDRAVKSTVFGNTSSRYRDPVSESMVNVISRRAAIREAMHMRKTGPTNLVNRPIVLAMHLLTSYSSIRASRFNVDRWMNIVASTFGDNIPAHMVFLDHQFADGRMDDTHVGGADRSDTTVRRENTKLREALDCLTDRYPTMKVLIVPPGLSSAVELETVRNFIPSEILYHDDAIE